MGFGSSPSYTPPPAVPPAASPPTLASASVASAAASRQNLARGEAASFGTPGGAAGVDPGAVSTGKTTLGGVS